MNSAIEIEKEKSKNILQAKTHKLQQLTKQSDELLNSLIQLEKERYSLIGNLISSYKDRIKSNDITISNFIKVLEEVKKMNPNSEQYDKIINDLIETLEKFKESVENLKKEVEINQKLLNRTKIIINNLIDNIEQKDKTYGKDKTKKLASKALLVNQSI